MANYPLVLAKGATPGKAKCVPARPGQGVFFASGDKLSISLDSSFSADAAITAIRFCASSDETAAFDSASRGDVQRAITFGAGASAVELFRVSISIPGGGIGATASIKDSEANPATNEHIWYTVTIVDAGVTWTYDPELINTGTTDTRRGFDTLAPDDEVPTR